MAAEPRVSQPDRLIILLLYLAGLVVASKLALGSWIPPTSDKGLWFYAALASLLLGSLLVTPFFTSPANAISYGVAAAVSLLAVNAWGSSLTSDFDRFMWSGAMLYVGVVLGTAVLAIALKDSAWPFAQKAAATTRVVADKAGTPRAVFSVVFLFALVTYHRAVPREYLIISLAWAIFVGLRPLEGFADLLRRWRAIWRARDEIKRLGEIVGHEVPGLLLIREDRASSAVMGDPLLLRTESGRPGLGIALDHVGFADGCWLRVLHLTEVSLTENDLGGSAVVGSVADGAVYRAAGSLLKGNAEVRAHQARKRLLGFVASDTSVGHLEIELVRSDLDVREGSLAEVQMNGRQVLFQIVKGITKEEILKEKNTRGFVRAQAKKIGCWNGSRGGFDPVPWLPQPNHAVLLVAPQEGTVGREAIGRFPGTPYPISIDPHLLVTHNTAILGILGVGKSFLALELVERLMAAGIKVICLDLTDQYERELGGFIDAAADHQLLQELQAVGPPGKTNVNQNVEEGGSIAQFTAKVREQFGAFLAPAGAQRVRILNPAEFEVWRQDSKPYQGRASMATLTPTEVTRVITEAALDVLQAQGMTDQARCCLVYEEAHSLIPEWNAVASDGDKTATNGTAKAILQGRKFGLGCLVITQRTANITKTILNQCNTVFALRVFDSTGMEFLKNYIGEDYAGVLSTLEERHAVLFGRASSCREPVLTRLNDRADFTKAFRETAPAAGEGAVAP